MAGTRSKGMSAKNVGRIQIHGHGIGEISDEDIERRALEIAQADGRPEAGDQDRLAARDELQNPGPPPSPEADETAGPIESWSKAPASRGQPGTRNHPEDEQTAAEQLVNEGLEEADRDRRRSASEDRSEQD